MFLFYNSYSNYKKYAYKFLEMVGIYIFWLCEWFWVFMYIKVGSYYKSILKPLPINSKKW